MEWLQTRFNSLLDNIIFAGIWAGGSAMVTIIKDLPIPAIIGISTAIFVVILLLIRIVLKLHIRQTVRSLLKVGIYTDAKTNVLRILYYDRDKLSTGMIDYGLTPMTQIVLGQLSLRNVVQLEQRKEQVFGSDNVKDRGYWILTELGKRVILYLEKHPQVLRKEGSVSK